MHLLFFVNVTIFKTFPNLWNIWNEKQSMRFSFNPRIYRNTIVKLTTYKISKLIGYIICSMITRRTVLGPPCISWPFVMAGVWDAGVAAFVPVKACAAWRAACADAFWKYKGIYDYLLLTQAKLKQEYLGYNKNRYPLLCVNLIIYFN